MRQKSERLISLLSSENAVYVQTHDFPDPDSIAAAFCLQYFLGAKGIDSRIIYMGELQTSPVESMIKELRIPMSKAEEVNIRPEDQIIIIDGCPGNNNVTVNKGKVVGVIDHHQGAEPEDIPFFDIRTNYGACSTILYSYLQESGISPTREMATAMAVGIHVDTNSFRRSAHHKDVEAFAFLHKDIDQDLFSSILRNNINLEEFRTYEKTFNNIRIDKKFAFYYYPDSCTRNLLGMLSDFFLSIEEVEFVALCAQSDNKIVLSVRSKNPAWNAGFIIRKTLAGIGAGGGHKDMAGGVLNNRALFNEEELYQRFRIQLGIEKASEE